MTSTSHVLTLSKLQKRCSARGTEVIVSRDFNVIPKGAVVLTVVVFLEAHVHVHEFFAFRRGAVQISDVSVLGVKSDSFHRGEPVEIPDLYDLTSRRDHHVLPTRS